MATARATRVLVVDDNEDAGEMLRVAIMGFGYEVEVTRDGPSAIELARTFHPHIALLDIGLPRMNGYELAVRLRDLELPTPVRLVALTGYDGDASRERAVEAGFEQYLIKPVDLARLRRIVDQASPERS